MRRIICVLRVICIALMLALPLTLAVSAKETAVMTGSAFADSLKAANDGDTIKISGTVNLSSSFSWPSADKTVTISGGTLDLSAISTLTLGTGVVFDNVTLIFRSGGVIYANACPLTIKENVSVSNAVTLYGGKSGNLTGNTYLDIRSGTYNKIYGGNNGGTLNGSTSVYVGGKVNESVDWTLHGGPNHFYGGGNGDTINGSTSITVADSAKANYVYGGSYGGGGISGGTRLVMSGGNAMSLYGGSTGADTKGDTVLIMTGGEVQQVFGGCERAALSGNASVKLLGGRVTRRVYGGSYNDTSGTSFSSSYTVSGKILLTIGENATIDFSSSYSDESIFAGSRLNSSAEDTALILVGGAYSTYKNKLGVQDNNGFSLESIGYKGIMASVSKADVIHAMTYSENGDTLTETCSSCSGGHSATARISIDGTHTYTGAPIEKARVSYGTGWNSGDVDFISYSNNLNAGSEAKATASVNGAECNVDFTIGKAERLAPNLIKSSETVLGKGDGSIMGLSTDMEYATVESGEYTPITDTKMNFAAGTYYVRYSSSQNYNTSPATKVVIGAGRMLKITFKAFGADDIVREVAWNETLTDIPEIPERGGYDDVAPYWSVSTFDNLKADMTVSAIYTPNKITVSFYVDGELFDTREVDYAGDLTDAPTPPLREGFSAIWDTSDFENITSEMHVNAVYAEIVDMPDDNVSDADDFDENTKDDLNESNPDTDKKPENNDKYTESVTTERVTAERETTERASEQSSGGTSENTPNAVGCGGAIGGSAWMAIAAIGACVLPRKKKE